MKRHNIFKKKRCCFISSIIIIFFYYSLSFSYVSKDGLEFYVQEGHSGVIISVDLSADGKFVLTGSMDKTAKLWNLKNGKLIRTFSNHLGVARSVAFSPDGRYVLTGSADKTAKLWDISADNNIRTFKGHTGSIVSVDFSPNGELALTGSADKTAKLWDIKNGRLIKTFNGHSGSIISAKFSPDGKSIVTGSEDKTVHIWNVKNNRIIKTFRGHTDSVMAVSFSPNGKLILSGSTDKTVKIWNISTGRAIRTFRDKSYQVWSAAFSPDGKNIVTDGNEEAILWDVKTGKVIRTFKSHPRGFMAVSYSMDGKYILTGGNDNTAKLWDVRTGENIRTYEGHKSNLRSVAFCPNGKYTFVWCNLTTPFLWDISNGSYHEVFKDILFGDSWGAVDCSTDGRFILNGNYTGTAKIWEIRNKKIVKTFKGQSGIISAAFSQDGKYIVTLDGSHTAKLWDVRTEKVLHTFSKRRNSGGYVNSSQKVAISPNGRYVLTADMHRAANLWSTRTGELQYILKGHTDSVMAVSFSHNGKYMLTGSGDKTVKLWDVRTCRNFRTFKGHLSTINSVAFSPDDKYVLTGSSDFTVKLWKTANGNLIRTFKKHLTYVRYIGFIKNGKYIISASDDGIVIICNIRSGKEICKFVYLAKEKEWIAITPEGFFNASRNGAKYLNVRICNNVYAIDQFYDKLYRPDLVQANLSGDPEGIVANAADKLNIAGVLAGGPPPIVEFVSPKEGKIKYRDVKVKIVLTDQGGGFGKILWKLNGLTIGLEESKRGIKRRRINSVNISKLLTLSPGDNLIEVIAYNKNEYIASDPAGLILKLKDAISEKPSLHILSIGINRYRDKALWLNYAVPDAKDIVSNLKKTGKTIFTDINTTKLYDQDATFVRISSAFDNIAKKARTNDVFILYLSGHGITLDGRYHFIPSDFRYRNEDSVCNKAINQDHLQKWMSRVQARKSLVLLDTCNSGSYVKAQAVGRGIAEKTAIDKLTRATGRATIAASADYQVAWEGYKGHGVFTYALLKALSQADQRYGNRDGVITTSEIASFIDEQVPEITYKKWGYEQVPQVNLHGRSFPVGVVK